MPVEENSVTVSRRNLLRSATVVAGGAAVLATALVAPRAEAKMAQAGANYQDKPKGDQSCANCNLFKPPSSCLIVDGNISPTGWCRFYAKKSS